MKLKEWRSLQRPEYYVLNPDNETVKDTIKWLRENRKAWQTIKTLAFEKAEKTSSKISISHLIEVVRWELEHIKIANAYKPVIARILEYKFPEALGGRFTKAKSDTEMIATTKLEKQMTINNILASLDDYYIDNGQMRMVV